MKIFFFFDNEDFFGFYSGKKDMVFFLDIYILFVLESFYELSYIYSNVFFFFFFRVFCGFFNICGFFNFRDEVFILFYV